MNDRLHLEELRASLSNPDVYPGRPERVAVIETHASIVFLTDNDVYKLKKPVDFGFLDYSTLEQRKQMCDLELSLNRRLAPAIYRDVVTVVRRDGGLRLGGAGDIVDYLVHMRRLPEARSLSSLIEDEAVRTDEIGAVAQRIAVFHETAAHGPDVERWGSLPAIRKNIEENFEQTKAFVGKTLPARAFNEISSYARAFLSENEGLLRQRIVDGMIRDGHGDLRAEHIYLLESVVIVDCIEFSDRLRCGDVAGDVGFLAMDLDALNRPDLSDRLVAEYVDATGFEIESVLDFYRCYRAYVRGKVVSFRVDLDESENSQTEQDYREARRFFHLAQRYAASDRAPRLILMSGLSGSGKSTLAQELSETLPAVVFDSDSTRKRLAGLKASVRREIPYGEGIYGHSMSARVYQELLNVASRELERGRTVILDATYLRGLDRENARALAAETGAKFLIAHCELPEELTRERLAQRATDEGRVSDGRWEIYLAQRNEVVPFSASESSSVVRIDSRQSTVDQAATVLARLESVG